MSIVVIFILYAIRPASVVQRFYRYGSNCWIPCHSVPPLFSLVGVLWRTKHNTIPPLFSVYRGYYTVAQRYVFYFRVAKQYFTNERSEWVKYCFCHKKIKFISSSRQVMFFLLYRQNDIDKIIEGNYQIYVIDKLMCEIMENKPLGSRM